MTEVSRRGAGEPIVMVHGIGSRWQLFDPIRDRLTERHETIAVDLPGFGASPLVEGVRPGPRGYAEWLAGWLAAQDVERPHLVGSSMGGGVALELGRRGLASSVTAFSPVGFWGAPGLRWTKGLLTASRWAARGGRPVLERAVDHPAVRVALLGHLFGHPSRLPADAARGDVRALARASGFAAARDDFDNFTVGSDDDPGGLLDIPVTIAWGTRDVVLVHRTQSARARRALPFARHVDLPGCGHLPFYDDPETCARLVLDTAFAATKEKQ